MKNLSTIFYKVIFVIVLAFSISCEKDDDVANNSDSKIFLSNYLTEVPNIASMQTIEILTNDSWEASSNVEWIILEDNSGVAGRQQFEFSIIENEDDERSGIITIKTSSGESQELSVMQEAGNKDDIYVKLNGSGDGYSWTNATNLDNALKIAVTGNTIHIAEGTYSPGNFISGGDVSNMADKTFEVTNNINIIGGYPEDATDSSQPDPDSNFVIFDGQSSVYHVVTVDAPKSNDGLGVVIDGVIIKNGYSESSQSTSVTINGLDFRRNYGAGVLVGGSILTIKNSQIINNHAGESAGLYGFSGSELTILNSEISNNISEHHTGGIWLRDQCKANIVDTRVIGNECQGVAAAIYGLTECEINLYNSILADNKSTGYGAAFYLRDNSKGEVVNTMITENSSTSTNGGGGVFLYANSEVTIVSSTIARNTIAGPGGGIFTRSGVNKINVINSIISGNEQSEGSDVSAYEVDATIPKFKASVIGKEIYDQSGQMVNSDFNFDSSIMKIEDWIYIPSENNLMDSGLNAGELSNIKTTMGLSVNDVILFNDLFGNSREAIGIMGAVIPN